MIFITNYRRQRAQNKRLLAFVQDLAEHGFRCDLNPTVSFKMGSPAESAANVSSALYNYWWRQDHRFKLRAKAALTGDKGYLPFDERYENDDSFRDMIDGIEAPWER